MTMRFHSVTLRASLLDSERIIHFWGQVLSSFSCFFFFCPTPTTHPSSSIGPTMSPKYKCPGCGEDKFTTICQLTNHREKCGQDKSRKVIPAKRPNTSTADFGGGSKRVRIAPQIDPVSLPVASGSGSHPVCFIAIISQFDSSN